MAGGSRSATLLASFADGVDDAVVVVAAAAVGGGDGADVDVAEDHVLGSNEMVADEDEDAAGDDAIEEATDFVAGFESDVVDDDDADVEEYWGVA